MLTPDIIQEMERLNIQIIGLTEVQWTGLEICGMEGGTLYYSGGEKYHKHGVGINYNI